MKVPSKSIQFQSFHIGFLPLNFRYNITNTDEPIFIIESLENLISFDSLNDHSLKVIVFAVNQKGRSPGVILKDFPFGNELENRSGKAMYMETRYARQLQYLVNFTVASFDTSFHLSPIVFGTLLTLLVLCCVIVGRMYTAKRSHSNDTLSSSKQSSTLLCKQDPSKVKVIQSSSLQSPHPLSSPCHPSSSIPPKLFISCFHHQTSCIATPYPYHILCSLLEHFPKCPPKRLTELSQFCTKHLLITSCTDVT